MGTSLLIYLEIIRAVERAKLMPGIYDDTLRAIMTTLYVLQLKGSDYIKLAINLKQAARVERQ